MIVLWLLALHFVCDYPLQGDFLARGKNHNNPLPRVPWWQCLAAHSFIHGAGVAMVTRSWTLGISEFVLHSIIDFMKCEGVFGEGATAFNIDQGLHVFCKFIWVLGYFIGV